MSKAHILIVEDELKIAQLIEKYLNLEGIDVSIITDGQKAIDRFDEINPDLVLLDIMLPGVSGIEVCTKLREKSTIPIVMLTARIEEIDQLIGYNVGADDYVCKPFQPKTLVAKLKAILKRCQGNNDQHNTMLALGNISVNLNEYKVEVAGSAVKLTLNEFNLLKILISTPNKVFSRQELLEQTQGKYVESYERSVDSHIKNLRKKLTTADASNDYIQSVYGVGYTFKFESSAYKDS